MAVYVYRTLVLVWARNQTPYIPLADLIAIVQAPTLCTPLGAQLGGNEEFSSDFNAVAGGSGTQAMYAAGSNADGGEDMYALGDSTEQDLTYGIASSGRTGSSRKVRVNFQGDSELLDSNMYDAAGASQTLKPDATYALGSATSFESTVQKSRRLSSIGRARSYEKALNDTLSESAVDVPEAAYALGSDTVDAAHQYDVSSPTTAPDGGNGSYAVAEVETDDRTDGVDEGYLATGRGSSGSLAPQATYEVGNMDTFEDNQFTVDKTGTLSMKSVRRGNPAFRDSIIVSSPTVDESEDA